ncbi:MAG: iron-containing alcohol dehydrogenase [Solobacterium sp.]|nr:iron-containing alcohol dehydrogenase [Solobacterium sp.]
MENYTHDIPTKILFGKGQIAHLPEILAGYGKRVLLCYGGGSIKKTGLYDQIMDLLKDFTVVECGGIEPNPRISSVARGAMLCRENNIDVVLAAGGGSVIDCAKAIAVGTFYEGDDFWEMVLTAREGRKALPLVDILTLSATGSEYDGGGVISNPETNEKFGGSYTYPAVSICDPTYTFTVSPYQTAAGSADIMSHVMEGYFAETTDSYLSDAIAEALLKTVIKCLPVVLKEPDNYAARASLMSASSIACSGIPKYGKKFSGWPCHALEHELSAWYDITHGAGLAILTPRWMRYILAKDPERVRPQLVRFARNVWGLDGDDEDRLAVQGIEALERLFTESGLPMTLGELGITDEHFAEMAVHADRKGRLSNSWIPLSPQDSEAILRMCL